jgi:Domain of unknown function (DUF4234)
VGVGAADVELRGAHVRVRALWAVVALFVVTLGLPYYLVWYYRINRELRDFGRALGDPNPLDVSPAVALLAVTAGGVVVVPGVVSVLRTFRRIRHAQQLVGARERLNDRLGIALLLAATGLGLITLLVGPAVGVVILVAVLVLLGVKVAYTQRHVNAIWRRELARAA